MMRLVLCGVMLVLGLVMIVSTFIVGMLVYELVEAWLTSRGYEGWRSVSELTSVACGMLMFMGGVALSVSAIAMGGHRRGASGRGRRDLVAARAGARLRGGAEGGGMIAGVGSDT